jgi:phosphodiesterase/alkaline phosphatase D-like protein
MKIVAASCSNIREVDPQPAWSEIRAERPDVLLQLGDNVYLERDDHTDPALLAAELRSLYARQFAEPGFCDLLADLRARSGHIVAIYDDHDFIGDNRCGGDCTEALRHAARAEFVAAFDPVRTGTDVYRVHRLGPVDLVVLDERFYRTSPVATCTDRDAILGHAQWAWLEGVVSSSTAKYLVIASSTTLHLFGDQSWEQYPAAFERMTGLLRGRAGSLVVSGDAHRNAAYDESGVIEIVTSAVAQRSRTFGSLRKNFGVLRFGMDALQVELRSLKIGSRFSFAIPLSQWSLP